MGTFSSIRTAFETVVTDTYPLMFQVFGTLDEIGKAEIGEGQDLFGLYSGFTIIPDLRGNTDVTENLGFYVGELAGMDLTPEQNNAILDSTEAKAKAIIEAFQDSEQANFMSIESVSMLPYYLGQGYTTSGVWVLCQIRVNQSLFC